ncbi:AAC(3) family N-acetyltransferase [Paenibacillus mesophilus]|uniref:AAC(3) family N-acetyltransferase n=1 Tax=Paenibacillus mesophilus TaxID=2582849 RepID=UPI00110D3A56|nr:AAC(3) family N-acetyltransferase [Paenibacillus mesophilus]TMV44396.1 AAC(3) family N-acetyltransferase [Paenibacillus mesophilus]
MAVTREDISKAIKILGLSQKPICVHSSLRSFGWVEGGAEGIVQCFLDQGCTILVPTFSWIYSEVPPIEFRPRRNGCGDYSWVATKEQKASEIYNPECNEIDKQDMGAIPSAILRMRNRKRGNHPLNSFTAIGLLAEKLITKQQPNNVYAPLRTLAELDGEVVLMGVGLKRMTALHLAEQMAGRNMFRRWSKDLSGAPIMVEVGGCSDGFINFESLFAPFEKNLTVGNSNWRVISMNKILNIVHEAITQNPLITHCGDSSCDRCNDAVLGGPIL